MLNANNGKLLVYASNLTSCRRRLKAVSTAVEKTARMMKLDFEIIALRGAEAQIYVYYKNGDEEPVPLYRDKDGEKSVEHICRTLQSMMFVLSFHPKYLALKRIRKKIMQFS